MGKKALDYKPMPEGKAYRGGIKVSWLYYETEKEAKAAQVIARHNAKIDEGLGYDFGYNYPGTIRFMDDPAPYGRAELSGLWEVCTS